MMPVPPESESVAVKFAWAPCTRLVGPLKVSVVPTTATGIVELLVPAVAVTVMIRFWELVPALRVAIAVPVASVVPWVIDSAPEVAWKLTGTPAMTSAVAVD